MIIAMKTRTLAEKARRALLSERMDAYVVSLDPHITRRGCSVGVRIHGDEIERAKNVLSRRGIEYGDIVGRGY